MTTIARNGASLRRLFAELVLVAALLSAPSLAIVTADAKADQQPCVCKITVETDKATGDVTKVIVEFTDNNGAKKTREITVSAEERKKKAAKEQKKADKKKQKEDKAKGKGGTSRDGQYHGPF